MRWLRSTFGIAAVAGVLCAEAAAGPFVVFPKAGELVSPSGRLAVRNVEREGAGWEFVGTFHSLWIVELATGRARKFCDYLGVAAVAWSGDEFLVATEYAGKKTSRSWVFAVNSDQEPVVLDKATLTHLVPANLRAALRENDHVFLEATRVDDSILHLRVWGYGKRDPNGFRWRCEYALRQGTISCNDTPGPNPSNTAEPKAGSARPSESPR